MIQDREYISQVKTWDISLEKKVRIALILADMKPSDIAEALGVSSQAIYNFITGKKGSDRYREWIRRNLGIFEK